MNKTSYRFRNIKQMSNRIAEYHKASKHYNALKAQQAKLKGEIHIDKTFDLKKAMRSLMRKWNRYYGNTSKYQPHQGEQECARRRRQIAAGIIKVSM